jgi:ABC-2 type transport system permease protein
MTRLAFKNFIRSGGVRVGLALLLTAGVVSLFIGRQFLNRQAQAIADVRAYQQTDFARNIAIHKDELGLLLYYLKFSLVNQSSSLSGLSLGQRDVNPSIQSLTIRALESQRYDAELTNPANLLLGNLDFSFVLIYLFPLLLIACCYNLISDERESGTWKLIVVQQPKVMSVIYRLYAIRVGVILGVLLALFVLAVPLLHLLFDGALAAFVGMSVLYVLFWAAVCFWVTSLRKRSSVNALLLVTSWLGLIVLVPTLLNTYIVTRYPTPEALETTLMARKGYHEKWDTDKQQTMQAFFGRYPQFRSIPPPKLAFDWPWYYAMQQLGDDEAATAANALRQKVARRETVSRQSARFIPSLHTQLYLNELAQSGLGNQLRFQEATGRFHEGLRLHFYQTLFTDTPVSAEHWNRFDVQTFHDDTSADALNGLLPLLAFIALFAGLGWFNFRKTATMA